MKFNDPYYIKLEKLHILIKLCNVQNYDTVLVELKEYTNELDTQFVRKTISAIGSIAVKYEKSVDKCIMKSNEKKRSPYAEKKLKKLRQTRLAQLIQRNFNVKHNIFTFI